MTTATGVPLIRHTDPVRALMVLPALDGRTMLASAGDDGAVRLWDPCTGEPIGGPLTGHTGPVWALAAVPAAEGRTALASAGDDGTVRLWDPCTGEPIGAPLTGHTGPVRALAAVPAAEGRTALASAGDDGTVRLWDPCTGEPIGAPLTGHAVPIWALAAVPTVEGRILLAAAGQDGIVRLWDPDTRDLVGVPLTGHTGPVWAFTAVETAVGGTVLASAGMRGTVRLWDPLTGDPVGMPLRGHSGPVWALAAVRTADGRILVASGGRDGTVRLWDPLTGDPVGVPLCGHSGPVAGLAAIPAGESRTLLASAGVDGTVRLWDLAIDTADTRPAPVGDAEEDAEETASVLVGPTVPFTGHSGPVQALAAVPVAGDRTLLASGGDDGTVRLWDPLTGEPVSAPLTGHAGPVWALAVLPAVEGRTLLASAGGDGTVRLWDPLAGKPVGGPLVGHTGPRWALAALPIAEGRTLLASGLRGTVRLWDPVTGDPAGARRIECGSVAGLVAVPAAEGRIVLASGGGDGMVRLWNPITGDPVEVPLHGYSGPVLALAAVPAADGRILLASAGTDGTVRLWDPATGDPACVPLRGHSGSAAALTAVPAAEGRTLLASGGGDGMVRLWDPVTGASVGAPLTGHTGPVRALVAVRAADGRTLLASGGDKLLVRPLTVRRRPRFLGAGDAAASQDLLGREQMVDVLFDLVAGGRNPSTEPPSVVSVEGRWGAGKSSVLVQLRLRLDQPREVPDGAGSADGERWWQFRRRFTVRAAARALSSGAPADADPDVEQVPAGMDVPDPRRAVAWFNPWAHQTADQVWAGLAEAVLAAVGPAVHGPGDAQRERYWFTRNLLRIDRRELNQLLWRRIRAPLLTIAAVGLLLPLVAQLATRDSRVTVASHRVPSGLLAAAIPGLLLLAGLVHTAWRYYFARASSFLPGTLFTGPILSGALAQTDTAREPAVQDPLYRSRSGYLYLVQHDVRALLQDLETAGGELVVFVDDLDRCTPATTAQVLEAINLFLSEQFPRARFVIGLDPEVVAAHIDRTYTDLLAAPGIAYPGDRTPGWTFLRKLIQLPVMLPAIPDNGIDRLLDDILTSVDHTASAGRDRSPTGFLPSATGVGVRDGTGPHLRPAPKTLAGPFPDLTVRAGVTDGGGTEDLVGSARTTANPAVVTGPIAALHPAESADSAASEQASIQATLERHPDLRWRIRERLLQQPERSARDSKRILTLWQFYVRLLEKTDPLDDDQQLVDRAGHLVIVAEIITRWPAHQTALRRRYPNATTTTFAPADDPPERGLELLAAAAHDDIAWSRAEAAILPSPADGLRDLLRTYDGRTVAALHAELT